MKYYISLFIILFLISCDEEDNVTKQIEGLPYANKVWYLEEIGGESRERTEQEFESLQLNEGIGFNSYRINKRNTVPDSVFNETTQHFVLDLGTWSKIENDVIEMNSDINNSLIDGRGEKDKEISIISFNEQELIVEINKFWGSRYNGMTPENKGIYKVRARYLDYLD